MMDLEGNNCNSEVLEAHKVLKDRIFNKDILDHLSSESLTQLIELEESNGSTIFHFISENCCDIHKYFFNICKRKLTEAKICEILLRKNLNGKIPFQLSADRNVFCNFIGKRMSRNSVEFLVSAFFSQPITSFVDKKLNNFVHHLAKSYYGLSIIEAFIEFCHRGELNNLESAIKARNFYGNTPLHILIERNKYSNIFEAILNAFGAKVFAIQDKWGCSIFQKIAEVTKSSMEGMLIKFCEDNSSNPEIRKAFVSAMMRGDFVDRIPLHDYMLNRKTKLFTSMCKILTVDEMKTVFLIKDEDEKNIFNFMLEVYSKELKGKRNVNFFNEFYSHCQRHSSWIEEIFADGTELNRVLVFEEAEGCYFANCIRDILDNK